MTLLHAQNFKYYLYPLPIALKSSYNNIFDQKLRRTFKKYVGQRQNGMNLSNEKKELNDFLL